MQSPRPFTQEPKKEKRKKKKQKKKKKKKTEKEKEKEKTEKEKEKAKEKEKIEKEKEKEKERIEKEKEKKLKEKGKTEKGKVEIKGIEKEKTQSKQKQKNNKKRKRQEMEEKQHMLDQENQSRKRNNHYDKENKETQENETNKQKEKDNNKEKNERKEKLHGNEKQYTKIYIDSQATVSVLAGDAEMKEVQNVQENLMVANGEVMTVREKGTVQGIVQSMNGTEYNLSFEAYRSQQVPVHLVSVRDLGLMGAKNIYIDMKDFKKNCKIIDTMDERSHIQMENGMKVKLYFEKENGVPYVRLYKQTEGKEKQNEIENQNTKEREKYKEKTIEKHTQQSEEKTNEKNTETETQRKTKVDKQTRTEQEYTSLRNIPLFKNIEGAVYPSKLNINIEKNEKQKQKLYENRHRNLTWQELHRMFGHASSNVIKRIANDIGMSRENMKQKDPCEVCAMFEKRKGHKGNISRGKAPNDIVYADIKFATQYGKGEGNYIGHLTLVDSCTHVVGVYMIKNKREATEAINAWVTEKGKIKMLKPDSESVLCKGDFKKQCDTYNIDINATTPYCQETNLAERYHQLLWGKVNRMIEAAALPVDMWPYALMQAVRIHNNTPCVIEKQTTTPSLKWGLDPIDVMALVPYGERVMWMPEQRDRDKTKGWRTAWYLASQKNGHAIFDNETSQVRIVRHVKISKKNKKTEEIQKPTELKIQAKDLREAIRNINDKNNTDDEMSQKYIDTLPEKEKTQNIFIQERVCSIYIPQQWTKEQIERETREQNEECVVERLMVSEETKQKLKNNGLELADDVEQDWFPKGIDIDVSKLTSYMTKTYKMGAVYAMKKIEPRNEKERKLIQMINEGKIKTCTPRQAMMSKFGHLVIDAMETELETFEERGLYERVPRDEVPSRAEKLRFFWIIEMKWDTQSGKFIKVKARCLANGKHTMYDVESYAPTVDASRLRILLALAAAKGWHTYEIDIKSAYTHANHDQETYMSPPIIPGRDNGGQKYMWKLIKNIYGLKQGAKAFYDWLTEQMTKMHFVTSVYDDAIFIGDAQYWKERIIIAFHVDDGRIICESKEVFELFMEKIKERKITCKVEGLNNQVHAGLEIIQHENKSIGIFQTKYNEEITKKFTGEAIGEEFISKPKAPPVKKEIQKLIQGTEAYEKAQRLPYRNATGAILWKAISTSPHIAYHAHYYSRYNNAPTVGLYKDVIQVIQYGRMNIDEGLIYPHTNGEIEITASVDSSWSDCEPSKRSTYGWTVLINGTPVTWGVKRSQGPMRSSAAAEFHGLARAAPEILMIRNFLRELGELINVPTQIQQDNTACAAIALKPSASPTDRHMAMAHQYVRYLLKQKEIQIVQTKSANMIADGLTKPLGKITYERFKKMINIVSKKELEMME